jgi:hypothetical protein
MTSSVAPAKIITIPASDGRFRRLLGAKSDYLPVAFEAKPRVPPGEPRGSGAIPACLQLKDSEFRHKTTQRTRQSHQAYAQLS